jgi:hypothetical protein
MLEPANARAKMQAWSYDMAPNTLSVVYHRRATLQAKSNLSLHTFHVSRHSLLVARHTSHVTRHTSIRHTLNIAHHMHWMSPGARQEPVADQLLQGARCSSSPFK